MAVGDDPTHTVTLLDARTWHTLARFTGFDAELLVLAFAGNRRTVFAGLKDGHNTFTAPPNLCNTTQQGSIQRFSCRGE
jgi:hypothetical protein